MPQDLIDRVTAQWPDLQHLADNGTPQALRTLALNACIRASGRLSPRDILDLARFSC